MKMQNKVALVTGAALGFKDGGPLKHLEKMDHADQKLERGHESFCHRI